jgi:glycosyltransferase involved in cell wall biosynthesis
VIAVSHALSRRLVEELGVRAGAVRVVPMGVDEAVYSPAPPTTRDARSRDELRGALAIDRDVAMLLFVGDLIPEKGLREALEALRTLRAEGRPVELCLVGDGPLRSEVDEIASRGESGLRVLGRQPPTALVDWYRASDVLVLPSHGEGTPLVVMEALTCGLPVVASRVGGIPEVVEDGKTGRLFEPESSESLVKTLREVLAPTTLDSFRRDVAAMPQSFGVAGRARALLEEIEERLSAGARSSSRTATSRGGAHG